MQKAALATGIHPVPAPGLVVSIHDVSPWTRERTDLILKDLKDQGVERTSLLVIPDHHHRGSIRDDPAFGEWLRARCEEGHEAVLHGFYHLRPARSEDGLLNRLITRSYTAGEGEFFDLSEQEARERLRRGRECFEALRVTSTGFIAPAWLLGLDAERAVKAEGFSYTTRIGNVVDFDSNRTLPSRSLVWSVRAAWRRQCSLVWNHFVYQKESSQALMRIGIHPPDWDHPAIRLQILRKTGAALASRQAMTYEGWLALHRTQH